MMQVGKQSQKHAAQLEAFRYAVGSRRPAKPHCSKELLNQRRVVDLLARQGCYTKAAAVQEATNGMEAAEMKATLATFEAEVPPLLWLPLCYQLIDVCMAHCLKGFVRL